MYMGYKIKERGDLHSHKILYNWQSEIIDSARTTFWTEEVQINENKSK